MPDPSREPSGEVPAPESRATPDEDASRSLAAAAPGDSVTADRLRARLVPDGDPARLRDVLGPDEAPQYLLEGVMADRVPAAGDLRRRMARPGGSVFALVTDRAVHLVVQYEERLAVDTVPLAAVRGATVEHAGGETRLEIDAGDERYRVYPSATPAAETEAAATALDEWDGSTSTDDPVSSLERLAGLYERGLLTDEEFAAAKRDLLG
jgi:hypothetical protein